VIQAPKSATSYQTDILQALANTGIRQFAAGGKARAYADIVADKLGELETREFVNLGETLLPYATGQNLDFLGEIFGVARLAEQAGSVGSTDQNFRFYVKTGTFADINNGQNIVVPANVRITTADPNGPVFLSDPITLLAAQSQTYFSARSATTGADGNANQKVFTAHNFTAYADSPFGSLLVTNDFGIVGGRDEETDDNYRYRIQLQLASQSGANEAAIRFEILQVPGIQDIVFEAHAGTFDVYVYGIATQISANLLDAVQQKISTKVAFPLTGNALSPDLVGVSLSTTVSLGSSVSVTDQSIILANAANAAQDYINNLGIGNPLVINQIATVMRNADSRIIDIGQPNRQILQILIWRSRTDGTRYSRYLLGNYTPAYGERIVVEVHDGLSNPISLGVAS
jgi:uncharacterized phage protein gp47/JayE